MGTGHRRTRPSCNHKRSIYPDAISPHLRQRLKQAQYGGKPKHKKNPGDFGLTPPALPYAEGTKCDDAQVTCHAQAKSLLNLAADQGLICGRTADADWPAMIWCVREDDEMPFEAQLENREQGVYHGYPLLADDPFRGDVLSAWREKKGKS